MSQNNLKYVDPLVTSKNMYNFLTGPTASTMTLFNSYLCFYFENLNKTCFFGNNDHKLPSLLTNKHV